MVQFFLLHGFLEIKQHEALYGILLETYFLETKLYQGL